MSNRYSSGQLVTIYSTFTISGVPSDPTKVLFSIRFSTATAFTAQFPTASTADAGLLKDNTGVYHFDFTPISAGTYYYRWNGFTAVQAAEEGSFDCIASRF